MSSVIGELQGVRSLAVVFIAAALSGSAIPALFGPVGTGIDATTSPAEDSNFAAGEQAPGVRTRGQETPEPQTCCLDAGGPYAGLEGDTITFAATQSGVSPPLVYIRWDVDGDGDWERTPTFDLTTAWSTDWTFAWPIPDDLSGDLVTAEAWDGVSAGTEVDTAFIDVRNVAPTVSDVAVTPAPGQEGSAVSVAGTFTDAGVRDDWEYRANWGDGTASPWTKVGKWEMVGHPRVLFLHTLNFGNSMFQYLAMENGLRAACGSHCTVDMWQFGQDGPFAKNRLPTFSEALQYDVIVAASDSCQWYTRGRVLAGNLLANYMDAGRGVVLMAASFYPVSGSCGAGIGSLSRWNTQGYNPLGTGSLITSSPHVFLGQVYEPSHFLMDGVDEFVAYMRHAIYGVRPGALRVADYTSGEVLVATRENPVVPNGARVVALNFFPGPYLKISFGAALDWDRLWLNSVMWAAHAEREKQLPIQVEPLTHVYGDNYVYSAALEVRDDDGGIGDGPVSVDVQNVNPEVVGTVEAFANANITLRVAGEKWHDVEVILYHGGVEVAVARVVRYPGSPDAQRVMVTAVPVNLLEDFSARIQYTPLDDPINGQGWGADPASIVLRFVDGNEVRINHNFNVRQQRTWTWNIPSFRPYLVGVPIAFRAMGSDVGSDDLRFDWNFGDGALATRTYYNNGATPDPYPSPEVNPISAVDEVAHAFASRGVHAVTLDVTDDDGGTTSAVVTITL